MMKIKTNYLINMNELENALSIVKNALDILVEESEGRRAALNNYIDNDEQQYLFNREQEGDIVSIIAFLDVVDAGSFDVRRDISLVHNRENQIKARINLKAKNI